MGKLIIFLLIMLILTASFVLAVRSVLSPSELIFNTQEQHLSGVISIETDTEPLLLSVSPSSDLKNLIDIEPKNNLRVSKNDPLTLKLSIINPQKEVNGLITINLLYEKLPKNSNYYGDDTARIPIKITPNEKTISKISLKFTEEPAPE